MVSVLVAVGVVMATSLVPTRPTNAVGLAMTQRAPKAEIVDGVPLTPVTASQRSQCQKFASRLGGRCPARDSCQFRFRFLRRIRVHLALARLASPRVDTPQSKSPGRSSC